LKKVDEKAKNNVTYRGLKKGTTDYDAAYLENWITESADYRAFTSAGRMPYSPATSHINTVAKNTFEGCKRRRE
jgi:hypothetical protein